MPRETILVVDDEEDILELVTFNLKREGYDVVTADSGESALRVAVLEKPSLIVLDLMLPGIDGMDVCRKLRTDSRTKDTPIIMLTAKGEESDIVAGLEVGAEDYVTKPFSPKVLIARIRRILRKSDIDDTHNAIMSIHGLTIDSERHEVSIAGQHINLTLTEFNILRLLARRPGRVFSRYQIVDAVHGEDYAVTDRAVDVQIVALRKKLGQCGKLIETVRGVGYRFKD